MNTHGITEYICDFPELPCVFKRLYSDFIVIEIPQSGIVLQPTKNEEPNPNGAEKNGEKETQEEDGGRDDDEPPSKRLKFLDDQVLNAIEKVANGQLESHTMSVKELSKEERKAMYDHLRAVYGRILKTNCKDGELVIGRVTSKDAPERKFWNKDLDDYLHFTMTKEYIVGFLDTFAAINTIAHQSKLKQTLFTFAGTKDRRGITTQRVCAYRVEKKRLQNLKMRGIWLNDFQYNKNRIQLGDLFGNRFSIILREIDKNISEEEFGGRVNRWKELGCLNYYGYQRFGSCGVNTAEVGRLILMERWKEAFEMLVAPREDARGGLAESLNIFKETKDATKALNTLGSCKRSAHIEYKLFEMLKMHQLSAKDPYKTAILALPRDIRGLYIHSYQSSVFNRIVSRRVKEFGLKILAGDLGKDGQPLDVNENTQIEDVFLPLPAVTTEYPKNQIGEWYIEIAELDGVSAEGFSVMEKKHFAIADVYRPFILKPQEVSWEFLHYDVHNQVLQSSEFYEKPSERTKSELPAVSAKVSKKEGKFRALKICFDLPLSSYATVVLRELLRTDFSKAFQKSKEIESES